MAKKKATIGERAQRENREDANYNFKQHAPKTPIGRGSFANLPVSPIFATFSGKIDYRDGIQNSPVTSVNMISEVDENGRYADGDD